MKLKNTERYLPFLSWDRVHNCETPAKDDLADKGVSVVGVEAGTIIGLRQSLRPYLWPTSQPHIAVVDLLPASHHFCEVERFSIFESPRVLSVKVDGSLYFCNARYLEDRFAELFASHSGNSHLVLICSGVNLIDASALVSLETINQRFQTAGIQFHLPEVKGPAMDQLRRGQFLEHSGRQVFLSQYDALMMLDRETLLNKLKVAPNHTPTLIYAEL